MRLQAFTLIEGIVSMVLLSLLLSIGGVISFNLYTSLPRNQSVAMKGLVKSQLDSLATNRVIDSQGYLLGPYKVQYSTSPWNETEHLYLAIISISDSLGRSEAMESIFVSYED